ncbi:MAG TPA: TonB-dependent receptor [Chitinispirillaceae bacterium]|nr:TonB-dependent receptor [Chitinispirillaceae bacterium]
MTLRFLFRDGVLLCTLMFSFSVIAQESSPRDSLLLSSVDSSNSVLFVVSPDSLSSSTIDSIPEVSQPSDTVIPHLQKIVVTSGRRERLLESNRSVLIIGPEEWLGTNKSVADVIAEHTGIQTRKYGGMGSFQTVSIRGVKGSEILVLLDGVPLNSAMGGEVDLGTINPMHLQEIEVYKGIASVVFGGNSLGGVINLKTKPKTKGSLCDLQTELGSFGKQKISTGINYAFTKYFTIFTAGSYSHSENNIPYLDRNNTCYGPHDGGPNDPRNDDTIRILKNNQYSSLDALLHPVLLLPGHNKRIVGNIYYSDFDRHIPAEESKENETAHYTEKKIVASIVLQHDDSTSFQIVPRLDYRFADGVTRWSYRDEGFSSSHGGLSRGSSASSGMAEHSLDGKLEMKYYPFENVKIEGLFFCQAGDANPLYDRGRGSHGNWHSRRALGGAAAEITTHLDHLTLSTGGNVSGIYDKTDGGLDGVSNHIVVPSDTITVLWNGEVGAGYKLFNNTKLYMNAGHYSSQPSLRERFGAKGAVMANPELTFEEVNTAEIGVKCNLHHIYIEGTAFYTRAHNTIEFKSDGNLVKPVNNDGSRIQGLEFSSIIEMPKYVSLDVAATWQKTKNLDIQYRRKDRMMPDEPEVSIATGMNVKPIAGLILSYKIQFKSVYFHDLANDRYYRVPDADNSSGNIDGTFTHDALLCWKVTGHLDLRLSFANMKFGKMQPLENSIEKGYETIITPAANWNFSVGYSF